MGADVGACSGGDAGVASVAADLDVDALVAAATDPDSATQAERLRKWMGSGTSMLDLRAEKDFERRRFAGAVNIPFGDLDGRLHELPPRGTPLCVLLKQPDGEDDGATFEAQLRVFAADFKSRPWRVECAFVPDPANARDRDPRASSEPESADALFLGIAQSAGVRVVAGAEPRENRGRLWEPSDAVARWLPRIERATREDDATRNVLVDLGCGAGRDAVFAALRGWHVLALDSDAKGLARCAALAATHGVAAAVRGVRVDLRVQTPGDVLALAEREAAASAAAAAPGRAPRATRLTFLAVRYMNRPLARALPALLPAGAFVCWFHFMRGAERTPVGRPNKARDLLEAGELRDAFARAGKGWEVLCDGRTVIPDGRPVSEFVASRAVARAQTSPARESSGE
jgi:SAM-dependent methyltransferase